MVSGHPKTRLPQLAKFQDTSGTVIQLLCGTNFQRVKEKSGVFLRLFWEEVVEMLPLETIPGYDLKI